MSEREDKLVRMANQIADFFRPYADEKAIAGVQEHLRAFWTKRMRTALAEYAAAGGQGLHRNVIEALRREAAAEPPIEKVTAGPEEVGEIASDAG